MADLFDKALAWRDYHETKAAGLYPYYHPVYGSRDGEVEVGGRTLIMAGSNDYLGLSRDPRLAEAADRATRRYGTTCSGSRLLNGTIALHEELEAELAAFLGFEAALVMATGFQTNLALAALLGRDDEVYADQSNHASLVDAARLGFARHRRYPHLDLSQLDRLLGNGRAGAGRLIVTDGMFSMEGDLCDLPGIVKLARQHGARVMVDGAHDVGLLGAGGRGVVEHFGAEGDVDLLSVTFSKCFGSVGGAIAGPAEVVTFLRHFARSVVYTAALSPGATAAALAALGVIRAEPQRRSRTLSLGERLRDGLRSLGFDVGRSVTPVVPVILDDDTLCLRFWRELFDEGVFANPVLPPAAPPGKALIRVTLTAAHTDAQLDRVLATFATVGRRLGVLRG